MISLRKNLLHSILLVIFVVTLLLALITYFSIRAEMDEFYDENLRQVAHTILNVRPTAGTILSYQEQNDQLHGEEEYLTQLWIKDILQYSSYPHIKFPLQTREGRGTVPFEGGAWRYYRESKGDVTVQLAQDLKERHSVVIEISGLLLIPILIQFPILAILIWALIGYGLRPLGHISNLIKNRNSSFLAPLPDDRVPVEINAIVGELNELLARLRQALGSQRRFTADAAHELRTPLTAVRLQLDILKRARNKDEGKSALEGLEKGVLRSIHLVQQLLELARHEPENLELTFSEVDLAQIVEECVEQFLPMSCAKNIHVLSKIVDRPLVFGHAQKLSIMIGNIMSNAVTYTGDRGHIEVTLRLEDKEAVLDVSDDGIGVPVKDRQRIFDRFYRVPGTGVMGSGLGLSIVRSIAELHNLPIQVLEGVGGMGTMFRIHFKVL